MKKTCVNEIENRITAFQKKEFTRDEELTEFFKLQEEMANIIYGETASEGKRFYDIANRLSDMNRDNKVSPELMKEFRKECVKATDSIKAGISGKKGENMTFNKLNYLISPYRIRKNLEISSEDCRTEIDALVVTEKAAFIIEVKNTKRDIFIDEDGQYYRTGEYLSWDSDIGAKLAMRESFVRGIAEKAGIGDLNVVKIVVFTGNRINVQNRCKDIKTCFLSQLTSIIDTYKGNKVLSLRDIDSLMEAADEMISTSRYTPKMDVEKFISDFVEIVVALNSNEDTELTVVGRQSFIGFITALLLRKAS